MPSMFRTPYGEPDIIADESFEDGRHCYECYWYMSCLQASRDEPCEGFEEDDAFEDGEDDEFI